MKFIEIKKILENLLVFNINDFKNIDDKFEKKKIFLWCKKGYIKNIRRGIYMLGDIEIDDNILFLIANKSYYPSYISFETALSFYSIIPETVYQIKSISSKKTFKFNFKGVNYFYNSINPKYFFGYKIKNFGKNKFLIGEIEKVLLDFLYFKKDVCDFDDFQGLRFNKVELKKQVNIKKILEYSKIFNKKFLDKKIKKLIDYIEKG